MSRPLLLIALALLISSPVARGEPPATQPATQPAEAYREPATGMLFPATAGAWQLSEHLEYPQRALGVFVRYRLDERTRCDAYVYDLDEDFIPDGIDSRLMKDHFERVVGDVYEFKRRGAYQDVQEVRRSKVRLGEGDEAPLALHVLMELKRDGRRELSEAYLLGFANHFFKIRLTYPAEREREVTESLPALLKELGAAIREAEARAGGDGS